METLRRARAGGDPAAFAESTWIPAFAGMTSYCPRAGGDPGAFAESTWISAFAGMTAGLAHPRAAWTATHNFLRVPTDAIASCQSPAHRHQGRLHAGHERGTRSRS